jgi:hypothetical protein
MAPKKATSKATTSLDDNVKAALVERKKARQPSSMMLLEMHPKTTEQSIANENIIQNLCPCNGNFHDLP